MKRAILLCSIGSILLFVAGAIVYPTSNGPCPASMQPTAPGGAVCVAYHDLQIAQRAAVLFLIAILLCGVAWVLGIIATARAQRWVWLVAVVVLSPFASLAYALFGERFGQVPTQPEAPSEVAVPVTGER